MHTPGHPCNPKENMILTRPPSSFSLWFSSDAHLPVVGAFCSGQRFSMGTLAGLQLFSPIHNKVWCTVCFETFFYQNQHSFIPQLKLQYLICWIGPLRAVFTHHVHQWSSAIHDLVSGSPLFLPCTAFDKSWSLQTWCTPQELHFGDVLTQLPSCVYMCVYCLILNVKGLVYALIL